MIRVPPSGTWERRRADLYGLAEDLVTMNPVSEEDALEHLVRRYLGGFGPASIAVRFLPTWGAALLAHGRRTQIMPEEYRSIVFNTKNPQSVSTYLVDGALAGTWRQEGFAVILEPLSPVPRRARRELEEEAKRLSVFLA